MFVALGIVIIIVCVLLSFIVLIQNPKGGGVSAAFGGVSNQILGAGRSTDVVEKFTWYFAIALLVLCLGSVMVLPEGKLVEKRSRNVRCGKSIKRKWYAYIRITYWSTSSSSYNAYSISSSSKCCTCSEIRKLIYHFLKRKYKLYFLFLCLN
jgi:preprotein translocase subunit SecG